MANKTCLILKGLSSLVSWSLFFTRMQCKQENYKKIISKHRERCPINDDDDDDNFISALACFAHQLIPVIFVSAVALDFQLQTAA